MTNATVENNFFDISGQSIQSQTINGVTANNNVFMASQANGVILGGGSMNWTFNSDTFCMELFSATTANPAYTSVEMGHIASSTRFYDTYLTYSG